MVVELKMQNSFPDSNINLFILYKSNIQLQQQSSRLQSTFNNMFGGKLQTSHIHPLKDHDSLLAIFGNQLYVFDLSDSQILKVITLSDNLITAWTFLQTTFQLIAIDHSGTIIEISFSNSNKNREPWYQNFKTVSKKVSKANIQHAKITISTESDSQFCVYFIEENNLYEFRKETKKITAKQVSNILYASDKQIIVSNANKSNFIKIITLNDKNFNQEFTFEHSSAITACIVNQQTLIFGDVKGKIYQLKNFFNSSKVTQQVTTKYEWHVHRINALHLNQEYLYSCGQEGTVVMWHLRQNKKDFLPRIGTEIQNVFTYQGIIYSLLKDNSIVSVDLSNDKKIKYYKTIINPFGFVTKSVKQNSFRAKSFSLLSSSQTNRRNLLLAPGLSGSLQLINLNDGSNQQINVLPRNMINRIDDHYPDPHEIQDVNFNKEWTLMCCSTKGINHNYLHFYKNEGFNLEYTVVSRIQNPHQGSIKIFSYNNSFITYAQNEKTIRFWSRIRRAKKSIIEKQEEYFVCSGEITYRQKNIKNCSILTDDDLLMVNYGDQIILIDLKKRTIEMAFRIKNSIKQAVLAKKSNTCLCLILVCASKIQAYQLNRTSKALKNPKTIVSFDEEIQQITIKFSFTAMKVSFLIVYQSSELIVEFDLAKNSVANSFENENNQQVSIISLCYQNGKMLGFLSNSCLVNLTDSEKIVKIPGKQSIAVSAIETQEDSNDHFEYQDFENLHKLFVQKQNVRKKTQITECLEKIQLQMYPSLGFSFGTLCQKILI